MNVVSAENSIFLFHSHITVISYYSRAKTNAIDKWRFIFNKFKTVLYIMLVGRHASRSYVGIAKGRKFHGTLVLGLMQAQSCGRADIEHQECMCVAAAASQLSTSHRTKNRRKKYSMEDT
jgi:hypothetical protein